MEEDFVVVPGHEAADHMPTAETTTTTIAANPPSLVAQAVRTAYQTRGSCTWGLPSLAQAGVVFKSAISSASLKRCHSPGVREEIRVEELGRRSREAKLRDYREQLKLEDERRRKVDVGGLIVSEAEEAYDPLGVSGEWTRSKTRGGGGEDWVVGGVEG